MVIRVTLNNVTDRLVEKARWPWHWLRERRAHSRRRRCCCCQRPQLPPPAHKPLNSLHLLISREFFLYATTFIVNELGKQRCNVIVNLVLEECALDYCVSRQITGMRMMQEMIL